MVVGSIVESLPSWAETLDAVCRVVPPRVVAGNPSTNENSNRDPQDSPMYQAIVRPDEFRVLVLDPGSAGEEIRCRMINVVKSWRTRYEALSYTWGDETQQETILVDGQRRSVTKNLYTALVHLRDPVRPRMLWADALCINQSDDDEKDDQVKKMGDIYSGSRRVVIFLGERTADVAGAFSILKKVNWKLSTSTRFTTLFHRHTDRDALSDVCEDWSPVFNLLRRPWFQRTWIIQEAVLAREPVLACGSETIPWNLFAGCCTSDEFHELAPDNDPEVRWGLAAVDTITHGRRECHTKYVRNPRNRKRRIKYTPDFRLVGTLYETRRFQCKDKRDKVFGVLSMVTNVGPEDEELKPNHRASVEEVFEAVAKWDIKKNESFELFSYCSRKESIRPVLPSWVPDFSNIDEAYPISTLLGPHPKSDSNAGFSNGDSPFFFRQNDKTVLVVSAKVVDSVARVGQVTENAKMITVTPSNEGGKGKVATLDKVAVSNRRKWFAECVRIAVEADPAPRGNPANELWASTTFGMSPAHFDHFCRAMTLSSLNLWSMGDVRSYAEFLYKYAGVDSSWRERWKKANGPQSVDACFRKIVHKRRFCITKAGLMGWLPGGTREGDLVCLVSGARVPVILRRVMVGEAERYVVVGDAYVQGLTRRLGDVYTGGRRLAII
ncbi:hypothetical protein jhhlp_004443 [Lomentospora prolificans]|uniref:Heterokaryon incompatibility domain-containing protein n=1 Tax=Lomentospora prolificans TaxID=41688 RepID=A0A2N3NBL0_9PEZI|nr:hypothetical protein jhhlp_004443 [Lomentospora prolificans]